MAVPNIIRDSFVGQIIYYGHVRRLFQYPEEKPGFVLPEKSLGSFTTQWPPAETDSKKMRYSVAEDTVEGSEGIKSPRESTAAQGYLHPLATRDPENADIAGDQQGKSATQ